MTVNNSPTARCLVVSVAIPFYAGTSEMRRAVAVNIVCRQ